MKRPLIEMHQENLIECDNKNCDYVIKCTSGDPYEDISMYLNKPCPKCGENLLTEQDYKQSLKLLNIITWLNKWFSWLTFFSPKKTPKEITTVKVHNGIHIGTKKSDL